MKKNIYLSLVLLCTSYTYSMEHIERYQLSTLCKQVEKNKPEDHESRLEYSQSDYAYTTTVDGIEITRWPYHDKYSLTFSHNATLDLNSWENIGAISCVVKPNTIFELNGKPTPQVDIYAEENSTVNVKNLSSQQPLYIHIQKPNVTLHVENIDCDLVSLRDTNNVIGRLTIEIMGTNGESITRALQQSYNGMREKQDNLRAHFNNVVAKNLWIGLSNSSYLLSFTDTKTDEYRTMLPEGGTIKGKCTYTVLKEIDKK